MHVVHLGRLKPPRKAAGQMDLLTVPSLDDADMRFRQDVQALSASSGDRYGPNYTSKADRSQLVSARNP
jgi:hypothetical protein